MEVKQNTSGIKYPILVKIGTGHNCQFYIAIDSEIIECSGNITASLYTLFQSFFVLHVHYPPQAKFFYRLLEKFMHLQTLPKAPGIESIIKKIEKTSFD